MSVDNPVLEAGDQLRIHNAHEPGEYNVIGGVGGDFLFESAVPLLAVSIVRRFDQEGFNPGCGGSIKTGAGLICAYGGDLCVQLVSLHGVENSLQVSTGPGDHYHNSHSNSLAHHIAAG